MSFAEHVECEHFEEGNRIFHHGMFILGQAYHENVAYIIYLFLSYITLLLKPGCKFKLSVVYRSIWENQPIWTMKGPWRALFHQGPPKISITLLSKKLLGDLRMYNVKKVKTAWNLKVLLNDPVGFIEKGQ